MRETPWADGCGDHSRELVCGPSNTLCGSALTWVKPRFRIAPPENAGADEPKASPGNRCAAMSLITDLHRIKHIALVRLSPGNAGYGVAWIRDDGRRGSERIGTRAQAEAVLQDL